MLLCSQGIKWAPKFVQVRSDEGCNAIKVVPLPVEI